MPPETTTLDLEGVLSEIGAEFEKLDKFRGRCFATLLEETNARRSGDLRGRAQRLRVGIGTYRAPWPSMGVVPSCPAGRNAGSRLGIAENSEKSAELKNGALSCFGR